MERTFNFSKSYRTQYALVATVSTATNKYFLFFLVREGILSLIVLFTLTQNEARHVMDSTFIQGRIDATKLQIVAMEDALLALADGTILSYTLDTGQTRQTVTKNDVSSVNRVLNSLYNRCATLEARLNGAGGIGRPCW